MIAWKAYGLPKLVAEHELADDWRPAAGLCPSVTQRTLKSASEAGVRVQETMRFSPILLAACLMAVKQLPASERVSTNITADEESPNETYYYTTPRRDNTTMYMPSEQEMERFENISSSTNGTTVLQFERASLEDFLRFYSQLSGRTIEIETGVTTRITLKVPYRMRDSEALLRMDRALTETNIIIVPIDEKTGRAQYLDK